MAADRSHRFEDLPDEEIAKLVQSLNSLHEGELGITMLVACGPRAIFPLREFLLHGKPGSISVPRQRAVRALADLQAKDVLLEYLRSPKHISDPVIRFGEQAVENTAARVLAKWQAEDVFQELLYMASQRMLPGVLETLGSFRRPEAVPYLIKALEDDVGRPPAEEALRNLGEMAWPDLVEAARTPDPSRELETPSSLLRRQTALRILADAKVDVQHWPRIEALLHDSDHGIAASVARVALQVAPASEHKHAFARMIQALEFADWFVKTEVEDALVDHFTKVREFIAVEITRRSRLPEPHVDPVLAVLVAVEKTGCRLAAEESRAQMKAHTDEHAKKGKGQKDFD